MVFDPRSFGRKQDRVSVLLAALLFIAGCASGPAPRPTVAGISKVLVVGFPGQVYDQGDRGRAILKLAKDKLMAASNFEVLVDSRDLQELGLVNWGSRGEPCLTFRMENPRQAAALNKDRIMALAKENQVEAVMVGGVKLFKSAGYSPGPSTTDDEEDGHLALRARDMGGVGLRLLGDADSGVTLEAILVGADGSCRWHGEIKTSLGAASGLKSMAGVGLISRQEIAYERITRGLEQLFLTLPKR